MPQKWQPLLEPLAKKRGKNSGGRVLTRGKRSRANASYLLTV
jgi:hypothetical protein